MSREEAIKVNKEIGNYEYKTCPVCRRIIEDKECENCEEEYV